MSKEVWQETKYDGYKISNKGNVIGPKGLRTKNPLNSTGYQFVPIYIKGKRKCEFVHRLVATAFVDNPNDKKEVNHIDGDKHNNDASNLQWVSRAENMKHAYDNGLNIPPILFGKDNPAYKHGKGCNNYRGERKQRLWK